MIEEWKYFYGDRYMFSNYGNIKSVYKNGKVRILKPYGDGQGYLKIDLKSFNKKRKIMRVSRIIAMLFVEKEEGKDCVDHINGIRSDNRACNLRWCTKKENANFPLAKNNLHDAFKRDSVILNMSNSHNGKRILCVETGEVFISQGQCSRQMNIWQPNIYKVLSGKRRSAGGFSFKYIEGE
jgi:hypothetical protein